MIKIRIKGEMKLRKQIVLATGLMLLLAACVLAASGAGGQPPGKGHGVSERVEIENNTVVFLGYNEDTAWEINVTQGQAQYVNQYDPQYPYGSNPYTGTVIPETGPRFSIAFVTDVSSNPNPQIRIDDGTYKVDVFVNGTCVEHNVELIVPPGTEQ